MFSETGRTDLLQVFAEKKVLKATSQTKKMEPRRKEWNARINWVRNVVGTQAGATCGEAIL